MDAMLHEAMVSGGEATNKSGSGTTKARVIVVEQSQHQDNRKSVFERLSGEEQNGKDEHKTVRPIQECGVNEADVKLPCEENKKEGHVVENRDKGGGSMNSTSSRPLFEAVLSSSKI
ncbi:hypothetical protein L6452_34618 [Arctium lappa]|uniref:Uncharacterized protein n=1 Tax=Arctium lappa TaxID=4217 RepID=A0ACB8YJU7_ARCLA|nr:hypothetical protein L6452_34618 [Arctium lappa]